MFFCFGFCFNALQIHVVPYATDTGVSAGTAALILATASASSIVGRIVLGTIGDKIGNKISFILGFVFFVIASTSLILSPALWVLYFFAVFFGLAWGNLATQQSPLVAVLFGLASHGLIFGVVDLGYTFGSAVGPLVSGYIYDISGSYQIAFVLSAIMSGLGIAITLLLKPFKHDEHHI
jgi:OFA family oxalate/formate antiporter-like MFS transporter